MDFTAEQQETLNIWVSCMSSNSGTTKEEARETILGWLTDGQETEVRDILTLKFRPHTIHYTWKNHHFCPGYYDCLRCAG